MLQVSGLCRSYGSLKAVEQVSFTVSKGEIVGLLGHNGAGKTTIMKMISGYLEPDAGDIAIAGLDLATRLKQAQLELGYLPENLPIYPDMVVADYLEFAAQLKGLTGEAQRAEIRRVVAATDIGEKILAPIATLSRGFKQRVGVAQAILGRPRLLILDEPTNGLDPTQTEHMRNLIRDLARDATVMLSTHIMQEVDAVCDRVLILGAGRLVVDERLDELRLSNNALVATSLPPDEALPRIGAVAGVGGVSEIAPCGDQAGYRYRLALTGEQAHRSVRAAVAKTIIGADAELFDLQMEQRDLETLFREVSRAPRSSLPGSEPTGGARRDAA